MNIQTPIDQRWFAEFEKAGKFSATSYLKFDQQHLEEQKKLFLSGEIENPRFQYRINVRRLEQYRQHLEQFQQNLAAESATESEGLLREAYQRRVRQQLLETELLRSVSEGDGQAQMKASQELYGFPSREILDCALSAVAFNLKKHGVRPGPVLAEVLKEASIPEQSFYELTPRHDLVEIGAEQIREIFAFELEARGIPWQARVSPNYYAVTCSYADEAIHIPQVRTGTESAIRALVAHEIGVHLERHLNGTSSRIKLLGSGLDGSIRAEEGIGNYFQWQQEASALPGAGSYIATALACGLHDGSLWSFREVFRFYEQYHEAMLQAIGFGEPVKATDRSWRRSVKLFRGSTGDERGVHSLRDTVYFSGFEGIRKMMEDNDPEIKRLLVGKYNPFDPFHRELLEAFGLEPSGLPLEPGKNF